VLIGGGGAQPAAQPPAPKDLPRRAIWLARKAAEIHVAINVLLLLTLLQLVRPEWSLTLLGGWLASMGTSCWALVVVLLARSLQRQSVEQEFARWFRVPEAHALVLREGWWVIEPAPLADRSQNDKSPPAH
jgi:hypothetical protein